MTTLTEKFVDIGFGLLSTGIGVFLLVWAYKLWFLNFTSCTGV
jgi:hypothetical protein